MSWHLMIGKSLVSLYRETLLMTERSPIAKKANMKQYEKYRVTEPILSKSFIYKGQLKNKIFIEWLLCIHIVDLFTRIIPVHPNRGLFYSHLTNKKPEVCGFKKLFKHNTVNEQSCSDTGSDCVILMFWCLSSPLK